jgi:hypothetical protein
LFADRTTIGFLRLGLVLLAVYLIASVPALVVGGRWLKGFGRDGVTADDPVVASRERSIDKLRDEVSALDENRNYWRELARVALRRVRELEQERSTQ